jgi:hypothetical protein
MVGKGFAKHGLTGLDHHCLCDPFQGRRYFFHALTGVSPVAQPPATFWHRSAMHEPQISLSIARNRGAPLKHDPKFFPCLKTDAPLEFFRS